MPDTDPGGEPWLRVDTAEVDWLVDGSFLRSKWQCIWGRGCLGILDQPAEALGQGCCSVGAHIDGDDEARTVAALARLLDPAQFQYSREAGDGGVFSDDSATNTRVVDGACIFLNRPGFTGGDGCALHLGAIADGERPMDWKPSVCWQLPIRVDWEPLEGGRERATLRRWSRADWGDDGGDMAWCCTEGERAYVGDRDVIDSLADELIGVMGPAAAAAVHDLLRERPGRVAD